MATLPAPGLGRMEQVYKGVTGILYTPLGVDNVPVGSKHFTMPRALLLVVHTPCSTASLRHIYLGPNRPVIAGRGIVWKVPWSDDNLRLGLPLPTVTPKEDEIQHAVKVRVVSLNELVRPDPAKHPILGEQIEGFISGPVVLCIPVSHAVIEVVVPHGTDG